MQLRIRPVSAGALFKATGNSSPAAGPPAKGVRQQLASITAYPSTYSPLILPLHLLSALTRSCTLKFVRPVPQRRLI